MQLPKRRAQMLQTYAWQDEPLLMTEKGVQHMRQDLEDLEQRQRPVAVEDLNVARQKGDLSENAEYQEAKQRLTHIDSRAFSLKEKLRRISIIDERAPSTGIVRLGSVVTLATSDVQKVYQIVGPQETNPTRGRISHVSPLGAALMGHVVGDQIVVNGQTGETVYVIIAIQ